MNQRHSKAYEHKNRSAAGKLGRNYRLASAAFQIRGRRKSDDNQHFLADLANQSSQVNQTYQLQAMADRHLEQPMQRKPYAANLTGMPDDLKAGVENLSGLSMDDVKVHYNSDKPARLNAHAFAQGTDIHLGSGQEKHLPHEAWHVVQQKQGRVQPTFSLRGNAINDDKHLETEADEMGQKAMSAGDFSGQASLPKVQSSTESSITQRTVIQRFEAAELALKVIEKKSELELDDVSDTTLRAYTREYFEKALRINPDINKAADTVGSFIRSLLTDDSTGFHVPTDKTTEKDVDGTTYAFYNDGNGFLEFFAPKNGRPPVPHAPGPRWDVNILDPATSKVKHTGNNLNSGSRRDHFKAANIEREQQNPPANGDSSPAGWTWHHHADTGRLQLIDRAVHAAFPHRGGFSIWGK